MTVPSAAAWAPPPKEHPGRAPSFDAWRVGDWLNQEQDARGYVPAARVILALRVLRLAGASVSREHVYVVVLGTKGTGAWVPACKRPV